MDYEDGLDRALDETSEIEGEASRFQLPDPEVRQEGSETVLENFQQVADRLDRDPDHLMGHLQNEVGTSATVDQRGRLRLKGEFRAERARVALETYARAYVICPECGLPDTRLEREQGAYVRQCDACGARSATGE